MKRATRKKPEPDAQPAAAAASGPRKVRDVMTRPVISTSPPASLLDALNLMRKGGVSGLPVINAGGALVGVLSERDVARALEEATGSPEPGSLLNLVLEAGRNPGTSLLQTSVDLLKKTEVEQAMSRPALSISPSATLEEAARTLKEKKINRLPVVDGGRVVGIITRYDVLVRGE